MHHEYTDKMVTPWGYGETPEAVMNDFKLNWERYKGEEWIKKHQI